MFVPDRSPPIGKKVWEGGWLVSLRFASFWFVSVPLAEVLTMAESAASCLATRGWGYFDLLRFRWVWVRLAKMAWEREVQSGKAGLRGGQDNMGRIMTNREGGQ
jgi:hypothetical protein